jgi:hypothetical protein
MEFKWEYTVILIVIAIIVGALFIVDFGNGEHESVIYESYTEQHSVYKNVFGRYDTGQTFIVNESHYIDYVNLYVSKIMVPNGNLTVSIRATGEKYSELTGYLVPIGEDLTFNSTPCVNLPDTVLDWVKFDFPDILLEPGTYAIIVSAHYANETAFPRWKRVADTGNYPNGTVVSSSDYGVTWNIVSTDDYLFEEYGYGNN